MVAREGILDTIVMPILSGMSSVLSVFVSKLADILIGVIKTAFPGVYDMVSFVGSAFRRIFNSVLRLVLTAVTTLTTTARRSIKQMSQIVNNVIRSINKVLNTLLSDVTVVLNLISTMSDYMVVGMEYLTNGFLTNVTNMSASTLEGNTNSVFNLRRVCMESIHKGVTVLDGMLVPFGNCGRNLLQSIRELRGDIMDRISDHLSKFVGKVVNACTVLMNKLNSLGIKVEVMLRRVVDNVSIVVMRAYDTTVEQVKAGLATIEAQIEKVIDVQLTKVHTITNNIFENTFSNVLIGVCAGTVITTIILN